MCDVTRATSSGRRAALVSQPLVKPEQETEYPHRWGAFCAASVEFLCDHYQVPCPAWVRDPYYTLETPWWRTRHVHNPVVATWDIHREN